MCLAGCHINQSAGTSCFAAVLFAVLQGSASPGLAIITGAAEFQGARVSPRCGGLQVKCFFRVVSRYQVATFIDVYVHMHKLL